MPSQGDRVVARMPEVPADPWADQRVEMSAREFDAVEAFVQGHALAGTPVPPRTLGAFFDAAVSGLEFAEFLPGLVGEINGFLDRTTRVRVRPWEATRSVIDEQPRSRRWRGPATLRWLVEAMATGRSDGMALSFEAPGETRFLLLNVWSWPEEPQTPMSISLTSGPELWEPGEVDAAAEAMVGLLGVLLGPLRLLTGCVTYDRLEADASPFEQWHSHGPTTNRSNGDLRGYCWANLLGERHLDALGGVGQFEQAVAQAGMVASPVGDSCAVMVSDPGPITRFDDERLAVMQQLLRLALPDYSYSMYVGWPLHVLKDPGTAFRKIPPGDPWPRFS